MQRIGSAKNATGARPCPSHRLRPGLRRLAELEAAPIQDYPLNGWPGKGQAEQPDLFYNLEGEDSS